SFKACCVAVAPPPATLRPPSHPGCPNANALVRLNCRLRLNCRPPPIQVPVELGRPALGSCGARWPENSRTRGRLDCATRPATNRRCAGRRRQGASCAGVEPAACCVHRSLQSLIVHVRARARESERHFAKAPAFAPFSPTGFRPPAPDTGTPMVENG